MKVEQKKFWKNIAFIAVIAVLAIYFNKNEIFDESTSENSLTSQFLPKGDYILALSWQAAFCEYKPNKPECRSQRANRFDASNFTLHGLWPQPESNTYCDASYGTGGKWGQYPKLDLSDELRRELQQKMPGYRSFLHRHEWAKHGSCVRGMNAERYFDASLDMLDRINASGLRNYIAKNIGRTVNLTEAAKQMDKAFGNGAGGRLQFFCNRDGRRNLISEIRISLSGKGNDFAQAMRSARKLRSRCISGIIDPVGLQ